MTLNEQYAKHMISGNTNACIAMEEKYGLHGYPPELVSVGLAAIEAGHAPEDAIYFYTGES